MPKRVDTQHWTALFELGQALATLNLRAALPRGLAILLDAFDARAATLAVPDEGGGAPVLEAAAGIDARALERTRHRADDGVNARVLKSGRPVIVPEIGREPLVARSLYATTRSAHERSLLCVPVAVDGRPAAALALVLRFDAEREYERDATVLGVAASMVGQAMRVARLVEAERQRLLDENRQLRHELHERYELSNIVGTSHAMEQVFELVAQAAPAPTTVLIRGESGTGKELIAHAIHYGSPRADGPFVKVNCGALPEALIESELFGHEPGAFTDARTLKKGRFELADRGTLFLDEVGELAPQTQVKLLRVLQEREFERLGGTQPIRVDVRLVAATNKDLELAVREGKFREDLYYRLNVFAIFVPPLRERQSDILLLADHFVAKYATAHGKDVKRIATSAIDMLTSYHWPGNVRELENCIERAILVSTGGVIHAHHLPPTLQTAEVSGTLPPASLEDAVAAFEKDLLLDALKSARGNRARAARLLGTTERIVGYKLSKYGIDARRFRRLPTSS